MAPKRKTTGPTPAEKRQKQKDTQQIHQSIHAVKAALKNKEYEVSNLPHEAKELLLATVDLAFKGEAADRHRVQTTNVRFIGEFIQDVRAKLEAALDDTRRFVEGANETEGELEANLEAAKQAFQAKKDEIKEREGVKKADTAALEEAAGNVEKAKITEKELEKQKANLTKEHTNANGVFEECFLVLKENPTADKKAQKGQMKRISQQLAAMNAGDSMTKGVPSALLKSLEERGDFDRMTINAVEELFKKAFAEREAKISAHDASMQAAADATEAAKQNSEAAQLKLQGSTVGLSNAEDEKEQCGENVKNAQQEIKEHAKKVKSATGQLKVCEQKVAEFLKTEEAFAFLQNFSSKKPGLEEEEPAVEEEAAFEEDPNAHFPVAAH